LPQKFEFIEERAIIIFIYGDHQHNFRHFKLKEIISNRSILKRYRIRSRLRNCLQKNGSHTVNTIPEESYNTWKSMTTMTAAATTTTTTTTTTFESYIALAEKALQKSRKSLDTRALIQLAYGNDTAHIGGSDMLMGILDSVVDKIAKETVLEELKCYSTSNTATTSRTIDVDYRKAGDENQNENKDDHATVTRVVPQERLNKIDQAISYVVDWEERRDRIEDLDAASARESLHQNLLPEGVTMEQVIAYREHKQRLRAREALQLELQRIEGEISVLQDRSNKKESNIRDQLGRVEKVEGELQASANVCAMVTTM
jgi:hypothetical protein